jgi:hypothetical protein
MTEIGRAAALVLAGVFLAAGVVKGLRPGVTAVAFRGLGLPGAGVLARVVPVAEAGLAVLLVLAPRVGAVAALLALAAFSAVLRAALRRGTAVACGCFGAAGTAPVSAVDLVRNGLLGLGALAALAAGEAGLSLPAVLAVLTATAAAVVVLALLRLRLAVGPLFSPEVDV